MFILFDDGYIMYPAVDRKPESLEVRTEACLMRILFDDGYMYQAVDIKPESLTVRTEDFLLCVLFDDDYDVSGSG